MASSLAEPMPQTIEAYKALAQRDLELIMEQREEIAQLVACNNRLKYSRERLMSQLSKLRWKIKICT